MKGKWRSTHLNKWGPDAGNGLSCFPGTGSEKVRNPGRHKDKRRFTLPWKKDPLLLLTLRIWKCTWWTTHTTAKACCWMVQLGAKLQTRWSAVQKLSWCHPATPDQGPPDPVHHRHGCYPPCDTIIIHHPRHSTLCHQCVSGSAPPGPWHH